MRTTSRTSSSLTEPSGSQRKELIPIELDIIHTGDCLEILKTLPDDSVHCCVTSPPYYALRDYGMEAQIGRETTPKEYISRLTEVFTEVRRVLRPDGTLWLNISDTYAGKGNQGEFIDPKNPNGRNGQAVALNNKVEGCTPKDMIGIPWMLAFALRDTGWYLRNDIIWMKDNPMPESVKDRCARCYEHIFLFSKMCIRDRSTAAMLMVVIMLPFIFFALYEKDGQPAEKYLYHIVPVSYTHLDVYKRQTPMCEERQTHSDRTLPGLTNPIRSDTRVIAISSLSLKRRLTCYRLSAFIRRIGRQEIILPWAAFLAKPLTVFFLSARTPKKCSSALTATPQEVKPASDWRRTFPARSPSFRCV